MQPSARVINTPINSALHHKIKPVAVPVSNRILWLIFFGSLVFSDTLMTALAFRLAYFFRFELAIPIFQIEVSPNLIYYQRLVLFLLPLWVIVFGVNGLYQKNNLLGGTKEYSSLLNSATVGMLVIIFFMFLQPDFILARGWLILAWGLTFFLTFLARFTLRRLVYYLRLKGYFLSPALVIGANQEGRLIADQLLASPASGLHILGFLDDRFNPGTQLFRHLHVLGSSEHLDQIVEQYQVEELIVATSSLSREDMVRIFQKYGVSKNVNVRLSSGLFEIITTGLQVKELAYVPLVTVNKVRLTGMDQIFKTILDYLITIPGMILLAPMFMLIGLAIKLELSGTCIPPPQGDGS